VTTTIQRVLVANRGEIAVRVIRACRELGVETVAVYSTADRESLAVTLADRAVCIGPPPAAQSYLNTASIIAAATTTGCDAVHPGYGFLSENPAFVRACHDHDLVFVGPGADVMDMMGDKARAKDAMRNAGLPLVPGSHSRLGSVEDAKAAAYDAGYPVLLKAAAGGGGRGMRLVDDPADLADAFRQASQEAHAAFGDGGMYLEKAITAAHHVEIQVVGDPTGGVLIAGERECSIQRRHQKLLEEAPSPFLDDPTRQAMYSAAEAACRAISYTNAGTIEFLVSADRQFYFMEMNTRLQVEHPVTEAVTGLDLVREQLRVASGEPLSRTGRVPLVGHAIELRLNAEDPARSFMPSAGTISQFAPPLGPGVRTDTHVYAGYRIPPNYDSLIAKLIIWAQDRPSCIARAQRALAECTISGVATTLPLFRDILAEQRFRSGSYTTAYLADAARDLPSLA
jgi:acetyl-CoA carboxylase, biotin carboxylase subunit